jgi:hypothetical protein
MIDVSLEGFEPMADLVQHAGYPGSRIVIALDPVGSGEPEDPSGGSDASGSAGGSDGDGGPPAGDPDATGDDGGDPDAWDGHEALPEGFGEGEQAGACACRADRRPVVGAAWALVVLAAVRRRRIA